MGRLAGPLRICQLLLPLLALGQEERKGNRVWPEEPPVDSKALRELVQRNCPGREEKLASDYIENEEAASSVTFGWINPVRGPTAWVLDIRKGQDHVPSAFVNVVRGCGGNGDLDCDTAWQEYAEGYYWPTALPIFAGLGCLGLHCICCFVACCRCCRRMICCHEGHEPRESSSACVIAGSITWTLMSCATLGLGIALQEVNFAFHSAMDSHMCAALHLGDEAIGGSELFLGIEVAVEQLRDVGASLDVDGSNMRLVRDSILATTEFAQRHEHLRRRIAHFMGVLSRAGPLHRIFDHRCVFCSMAVGDPDNPVPGFPKEGLLPALLGELSTSSSEAIERIRNFALAHLVGTNLTLAARQVKRALKATEVLESSLREMLLNRWARRKPSVDSVESIRMTVFCLLTLVSVATSLFGWLAFLVTRLRARARPDLVPSGKPHCVSWCCGFCTASLALLLAGSLIVITAVGAEGCIFLREELATPVGYERHAAALQLGSQPLAVELAHSCFTLAGDGDLTEVLGLTRPLHFQVDLLNAFYNLDATASLPPAGQDTGRLLSELKATAELFGGLFVLDPPATAGNTSLGTLSLSTNVRDLLLGSGTAPDDSTGPDGASGISGLNSFAALIAGPGKYTFAHGTAGGGFVITPSRPTNEEMDTLPEPVRNALLYARNKERLLTSEDALPCDELNEATAQSVERRCSITEFRDYVAREVALVQSAVDRLASEAEAVERQMGTTLKAELLPMLRKIRDVRTAMGCRALFPLFKDWERSLCEGVAPVAARGGLMSLFLAVAAGLCILVQYKVWRHLKDNKVLAYEVERFEERLRRFDQEMKQFEEEMASGDAAKAAWKKSVQKRQENVD